MQPDLARVPIDCSGRCYQPTGILPAANSLSQSGRATLLEQFVDVFGFLSVLLRGASLCFSSLLIGGTAFMLFVLRPSERNPGEQAGAILATCSRLMFGAAVALATTQALYVGADAAMLMGTTGLSIFDLTDAAFFLSGSAAFCGA